MAKYLISLVLGPQISNIFMYSLTRSFCGRVGRTPVPKRCNVGAGLLQPLARTQQPAQVISCAFKAIKLVNQT